MSAESTNATQMKNVSRAETVKAVEAVNRANVAEGAGYVPSKLKFEQGSLLATFGTIKRNVIETAMRAIGLDPNVSNSYAKVMMDPSMAINVRDKVYFPHTAVGSLMPYNEAGNPSGGCFSLYTVG